MDEQKTENQASLPTASAGESHEHHEHHEHQAGGLPPEKHRTLMAALAYVLFFIPLLTGDAKKDEFVKYHTKQGFALFIVAVGLAVVESVFSFIFWFFITPLLNLAMLALFIIGLINVFGKKKEPLPVIGGLSDWLKI